MPTPVSVRDKRAKARKRRAGVTPVGVRSQRRKKLATTRAAAVSRFEKDFKKFYEQFSKEVARSYKLGTRGTTPQGPRLTKGRKGTPRKRIS
jgi:hypothetical protein